MDLNTQLPASDDGFVVELERFQGPLDLLLHLIRQQDVDIFDIPIAQITQQFLAAISRVHQLGLDQAGEFLEMAATLIRIKSQMLLPRRALESGEMEDPRAELVRRLLEYEHFRDSAQHLSQAEAERARHFARGYVPPRRAAEPIVVAELQTTWDELFTVALALVARERKPIDHHVATRPVPIEEKIGLIAQALARVSRIEFRHLVEPFADRLHTVVTFMAGLELAKRRQVALRQREPFADLWLYRTEEPEPADEMEADPPVAAHPEVLEEGSSVA
ncbi:MAG: segregation and condensation protein A [Longimicrobiales bacterium]